MMRHACMLEPHATLKRMTGVANGFRTKLTIYSVCVHIFSTLLCNNLLAILP